MTKTLQFTTTIVTDKPFSLDSIKLTQIKDVFDTVFPVEYLA